MFDEWFGACMHHAFLKKPHHICVAEQVTDKLERNLSLFDLLCIGVGGTVGSGVFVLTGLIAREYAGPGVVMSWIIAGLCCMFSAASYAELSCRIPSAGSTYAYAFVALGELPAVVGAAFLCLEYGISGAAVARSWGDKLIILLGNCCTLGSYLRFGSMNIVAALLQGLVVLILLAGVSVGKLTVNFFTVLKMAVVLFIIVAGFFLFEPANVSDWTPYGSAGILRGTTAAFFGYVGYDEVCCMAAEAKNPQKTLPVAVFGTIAIVTVFYAFAALALVGMQLYTEIDSESGFSLAFQDNHWQWASQLVAVGELVTLPIVVLISFMAQPRLQYAMAVDGLLPPIFKRLDRHGNLRESMIITGIALTLVALLVPFTFLDDMVSAGVLLSFNLTNSSLVVIRRQDSAKPARCVTLLAWFNAMCFLSAMLFVYTDDLMSVWVVLPVLSLTPLLYLATVIASLPETDDPSSGIQYRVPWVPIIPLVGIYLNYFLIAQLSWDGILQIVGYISVAVLFYFYYGMHHSVGNTTYWADVLRESSEMPLDEEERNSLEDMLFGRASKNYVIVAEHGDIRDDDRGHGDGDFNVDQIISIRRGLSRSASPSHISRSSMGSGVIGSGGGQCTAISNPLAAIEHEEEF